MSPDPTRSDLARRRSRARCPECLYIFGHEPSCPVIRQQRVDDTLRRINAEHRSYEHDPTCPEAGLCDKCATQADFDSGANAYGL